MPKLKASPGVRRGEIIDSWRRFHNLDDDRAARILGMSATTLKRRRRSGDWSVEELHRAIRGFHIPPLDALDLLTVGCYPMEQFMEKEKRKRYGDK